MENQPLLNTNLPSRGPFPAPRHPALRSLSSVPPPLCLFHPCGSQGTTARASSIWPSHGTESHLPVPQYIMLNSLCNKMLEFARIFARLAFFLRHQQLPSATPGPGLSAPPLRVQLYFSGTTPRQGFSTSRLGLQRRCRSVPAGLQPAPLSDTGFSPWPPARRQFPFQLALARLLDQRIHPDRPLKRSHTSFHPGIVNPPQMFYNIVVSPTLQHSIVAKRM